MTKHEAHDLKPGERLLKLTDEQYNKIKFAIDALQRISLQRIEDYRKNDPNALHKDVIQGELLKNYTGWCNLQTELENCDI